MATPRETLLCRYSYDALDRLTSNELPNEPEHQRFYFKSRLATEIQGANRYSVFQHSDQLLAQQQKEGGSLDTTLLTTDQQRSVLQTLKTNQPQRPIAYSPYGHRPAGNGLFTLLGFNGERPDRVTGWYLLGNGYRAFNPFLMRFNSPDSLSPFDKGGLNSYAYCAGEPINESDPTGHFAIVLRVRSLALRWLKATRKTNALMPPLTANLPIPHSKTNGLLSLTENTSTKKIIPEAKIVPIQHPTNAPFVGDAQIVTEARTSTPLNTQTSNRRTSNWSFDDIHNRQNSLETTTHPARPNRLQTEEEFSRIIRTEHANVMTSVRQAQERGEISLPDWVRRGQR